MNENLAERFRELPVNLANHVEIVILALFFGLLISIPLAIFIARRERLRYPVLTIAGLIQTIPGLALLALMVPLLVYTKGFGIGLAAFGFYPAVFALTLYSILPILRNTVTGLLNVDPSLLEAARGLGMSERQRLFQVELPLAAPVIIAGIRTATVWTVGVATLATPVGQPCLGNYIFAGLQTRNWLMVIFGVVCSAALAVVLDLAIGGLERAAAERRRGLALGSGGALLLVVIAGLVSPRVVGWSAGAPSTSEVAESTPGAADAPIRSVKVGAKTFSEQYILAALIRDRLEAEGIAVETVDSLGSTVAFGALANSDVDVTIEYAGTIWANYMKRGPVPAPWRLEAEVRGWLAGEHGIRELGALGFENAYGFAVRREMADELGLETVSDLVGAAPKLVLGSDYEFMGRPEWAAIRDAYGLQFKEARSFDPSFMYQALSEGQVDIITAFTSDGRIAALDLVVLRDDRNVIPPYDALLLLSPRVAGIDEVRGALEALVGAISVEEMREANYMVDREDDKKTPAQAAKWLAEHLGATP